MPKEHEHIYTSFVDYDENTDMATARCECGSTLHFPSQAKNRVSAWSAYPDKFDSVVKTHVDQERLEGDTMDETDGHS
jgi:hypothetical protein